MDLLWCASKTRRKGKGSDAAPPSVPDELRFQTTPSVTATPVIPAIPEVNMDLSGMEYFSLLIARGRNGFGFTVFGASPVQIGRVDDASPAFKAGLRRYDCIVRINGLNVSRSMAESVARIVRDTDGSLRLDVQRYSTGGDTPASSTWRLDAEDESIGPSADEAPVQRPCLLHGKPQLPPRRPFTQLANNVQAFPLRAKANADQYSLCSLACDRPQSACMELSRLSAPIAGSPCSQRTPMPGSRPRRKAPMPLPPTSEDKRPGSGQGSKVNVLEVAERRAGDKEKEEEEQDEEDNEEEEEEEEEKERGLERDLTENGVKLSPITDDKKISSYEQDQRPAIQRLVECEEQFVLQMELGLQRYLRPLRMTLLSPEDHSTVFQNLQEVISLSECCLREMKSSASWCSGQEEAVEGQRTDGTTDNRRLTIRTLSSVYLSKVDSVCSAYESYCPGVMNALHYLASMKRSNPELYVYLKKASLDDKFTISAFLQKPIEHIKELVLTLQRILCYMEATSSDYSSLKQVVQAMRNCCSTINVSHMQRCSSSMSSLSSLESIPMKSFSSSSSSTNSAAASVVSSIDTEVLEMQKRLVFPDNVRSFHLATASHHMIYSGRLTLFDRHTTLPLFVALLSDLVLLTRPDRKSVV